MKIVHVLGARRNSLKVAPVIRELARRDGIIQILAALDEIDQSLPLLFSVRPYTRRCIYDSHLTITDPAGYLDFLVLQRHATLVITDSGGVHEETTYLGVLCLMVREKTERPINITLDTNILVGRSMVRLWDEVDLILNGQTKNGQVPTQWDGKAGERIALIRYFSWHNETN